MEAKAASRILRLHSQNSRDPFHILDNPRNLKQARSTFRKLALLLHPDKCGKLPICEEAFKVVNNAYRRIESEYGAGDEAPAVEDIFNFNETTTSAAADADVEPAVSPTDVRAARCNWANGKARSGVGEDGPRFADDRADFPFTAGTASCGVSTEGYRAPSRDEWVRRWDKENLGPVSMDQVKAARTKWGTPTCSQVEAEEPVVSAPAFDCAPLVDLDCERLVEDELGAKRSIARAQATAVIKEGKARGIWAQNRKKKRKKTKAKTEKA